MSVRLLASSSPVDSTLRGITSGRTGTPDRRPPCLVRLLIYTTGSLKMISQNYLITFNHYFSAIISKFHTTETVQLKVLFFFFLFVTEWSEPPTPHYNSSILGDLLPRAHLQFLSAVSSQCSAFADGVALLKVWLRQRELDQVGGLQTALLLLLLLRSFYLLVF